MNHKTSNNDRKGRCQRERAKEGRPENMKTFKCTNMRTHLLRRQKRTANQKPRADNLRVDNNAKHASTTCVVATTPNMRARTGPPEWRTDETFREQMCKSIGKLEAPPKHRHYQTRIANIPTHNEPQLAKHVHNHRVQKPAANAMCGCVVTHASPTRWANRRTEIRIKQHEATRNVRRETKQPQKFGGGRGGGGGGGRRNGRNGNERIAPSNMRNIWE